MANYCDPMKIWVLVYKDKVLVKDALEAEDAIIIKFPSSEPSVYNPMVGWDTDGASIKEGYLFNMILNDGTTSNFQFKDRHRTKYYLPKNKKIEQAIITSNSIINGFTFHFTDGYMWQIGFNTMGDRTVIQIAKNEVIVGFVAKFRPTGGTY